MVWPGHQDQINQILYLGPVTLHAGSLDVLVSGHKEEMIVHQLLSDRLVLNNRISQ